MDRESVDSILQATYWPRMAAASALGMLALFLLVATVSELKSYHSIGLGIAPTATISASGEGEIFAEPDTAEFGVSVQETAKDVKTAQTAATEKGNAVVAYLKQSGVDAKDIKTTDYSIAPQYEWRQGACAAGAYCPPGRQVLTGYQVSETLSVKVRDLSKAGALLSGVGDKGASVVSGLTFTVADQKALEAEARDKAIGEARGKAEALAKSLGVSLVRVVGFSEGGGGPVYYAKPMAVGLGGIADSAAPAPQLPPGQNKITSDVTVTYEIK